MTQLLTDSLSVVAASPNGIKKLRQLILKLAVMGKLVPQDSSDEPAEKLLKRLRSGRQAQLENEAENNPECRTVLKKLAGLTEANCPYSIPKSWSFVRLLDCAKMVVDCHNKTAPYARAGVPIIRTSNIRDRKFRSADLKYVTHETYALWSRRCPPEPGDIIFTREAPMGEAAIIPDGERYCLGQRTMLIRPMHEYTNKHYLLIALTEPGLLERALPSAVGLTVKHFRVGDVEELVIPLPPLAEQHRIVAKVDELMALCDQLDCSLRDAEAVHVTLVQILLCALTAGEPQEFSNTWNQIKDNFDVLFASCESMVFLKRTIIQLATMGRLGTHRMIDEPASSVIELIRERKAKLNGPGQRTKEKPLPPVDEAAVPYNLPSGWVWARIGDLALKTDYGISEKTFEMTDGVPVLKMGDIQDGRVVLGVKKKTPEECVPADLFLKPNDLLYNRTNSAELVGKTGLFDGPANKYTFASYLIRIRVPDDLLLPQYLNLAMNAPNFRETQIIPHVKQQCGQANVNGTIMRNMLVPVPPTEEQRRIIARIDRLSKLCDELANILSESSAFRETVSEALINACFDARNPADKVGQDNVGNDQTLGALCI